MQKTYLKQKLRKSLALDWLHAKLPVLFVKGNNKPIKNSFSANKVKRCTKLIRKSYFAINFLSSYYHFNFVNIPGKLGRSALKNPFFHQLQYSSQ